jgi:DNA repair protein RecO (recombination protein O)
VIDYYTHENNDERMMFNLLYQSLKALEHPAYDNRLIRYIFEIKALVLNGEYPGMPAKSSPWHQTTIFTIDHIVNNGLDKLYTFSVSDNILAEIAEIAMIFRQRFIDRPFKSLEVLENL